MRFPDSYDDDTIPKTCTAAEVKDIILRQFPQRSWHEFIAAHPPIMNMYERDYFKCVQERPEGTKTIILNSVLSLSISLFHIPPKITFLRSATARTMTLVGR